MSVNLIKNGGFETDWSESESHDVLVCEPGQPPSLEVRGNIFTPPKWTTWFKHDPDIWDQPEVRDAHAIHDPRRVHSGEKAMLFFTFWRRHDGGFYQHVNVTPGQRLRLTAFAHAWSNNADPNNPGEWPKPDDPRWSEGDKVGYREVSLLPNEIPPINGDQQNDANGNFFFTLGIDPMGGANPFAASVVWGVSVANYNAHAPVPAVEAVAQSNQVTVFARSTTKWAFKHSDFYLDDVSLVVIDGPPPTECRGLPRTDYARIYNVIPENATEERAVEIFVEGWRRSKETAGGSYDDAGIGDLPDITVNLHDIPVDLRPDFTDFYTEHYPGVKIKFKGDVEPPPPSELELVYPTTHLPAVITQGFHAGHQALDIRASYNVWGDENICALDATVLKAGWDDDVFGYQVLTQTLMADGRVVTLRYAHMLADLYVQAGQRIVAGQKLGKAGGSANPPVADHLHFSVNVDGQYVDPEPLIDWPDKPPPPTGDLKPMISLHFQSFVEGGLEYIGTVKPRVAKTMTSMQDVVPLIQANPDIEAPIWRHWVAGYDDVWAQPVGQRGAFWLSKFGDSLPQVCDMIRAAFPNRPDPLFYVESLNEVYASDDHEGLLRSRDVDIEFLEALAATGLPVGGVVFTAGVGNPHESEYVDLIPLARACERLKGILGYHNYWPCNLDQGSGLASHWIWMAGRWTEMDKVFSAAGVRPLWASVESGAIGAKWGDGWISTNAGAGWRHSECCGGDWDWYLRDIMEFDRMANEWNRTHGNRYLGATLFTSGANDWQEFEVGKREFEDIAVKMAERYA